MTSIDRRRFIEGAAATVIAGPLILNAKDKADAKRKVLGVDGYRYEVEHHCLDKPANVPWDETHGICVDAAGLVYVKHRSLSPEISDAILVFDDKGKFVRSFGREFHSGGHGIDVRTEGKQQFLFLSDLKGYIAKTTLTGEVVWKQKAPEIDVYAKAVAIPEGKVGRGRVFVPTNIAFAPNGDFYVADAYGSHYILHYNSKGESLRHWGGRGSEPGKMSTPHGLWWDDRDGHPKLCVADRANKRLQYFTPEGKFLSIVEGLLFPADVDRKDDLLLVPDLHARVTLLGKDNQVIAHLGDDEHWRSQVLANNNKLRTQPKRWEDGRFVHPHDACFAANGDIYVVEWVRSGRVSRLRRVS